MSREAIILDDVFEVIQKDPDGKKFDRGGLRRVTDGSSWLFSHDKRFNVYGERSSASTAPIPVLRLATAVFLLLLLLLPQFRAISAVVNFTSST
jgi:hypothetical protein